MDIYRPISFKLYKMKDTTRLYILILVWMTLTFILEHNYKRNHICLHSFSCKFLNEFGWNLVCSHNLYCSYVKLNWHDWFSRRELFLGDFIDYTFSIGLVSGTFHLISFKLGVMLDITTSNPHFDTSLNDLDLHWRSQGYKKFRTCAIIMLQSDLK